MQNVDGKLISGSLEGHKALQWVPIVIRYTAGVPAVLYNPCNEPMALTDVGTGEVTVTLTNASLMPLIIPGIAVRPTAPNTLGLNANLKGASTTTAFTIVVNSDADGVTETDPVDLHLSICKLVVA